MRTAKNQEIEFKWQVSNPAEFTRFLNAAKKAGLKLKTTKQLSITDYYIDDSFGILKKLKKRFRIRHVGKNWYLTAKGFSVLKRGLAKRSEETKTLHGVSNLKSALSYCENNFFINVKLHIVFTIQNQRTARVLELPKRVAAEASFDRVRITRNKKTVRMQEIELEFLEGRLVDFKRIAKMITNYSTLKLSTQSKVMTAIKAFRLK